MFNNSFTPIPKWILKNKVLSAGELYVYSYMYDGWNYARKQNRKYQISIKKLISEIGYDKKTILSAIEKMEKNEIIFITKSKRTDNRDEKNIYEFNTDKVWVEKTPLTPDDNSSNMGGENSTGRVEKTPLHTKENKEKKNNNLNTIGTSTGTDEHEESYKRIEFQKKRIEKWSQNPQLKEYKTILASEFMEEADWFEKDIRNNLTEDEWYSIADYFNRVKDELIEKIKLRAA